MTRGNVILLLMVSLLIPAVATGKMPALHKAAQKGDVKAVEALLKDGANMHATDKHGRTALTWAAGEGHAEVVTALLEAGADVAARDTMGRTALDYAQTPRIIRLIEGR